MKTAFRVAVIGCGAISGNHIKGILASDQILCALCDIDPAQSARVIEKYELKDVAVYTDYTELLEKEKPDAVHICTPHYLHTPMCIEALQRNIHVLCEKPLGISMQQLAEVQNAAKNSKAQLGVCQQNRYEPNILRAKELVAEEGFLSAYGDVVWMRNADYYNSADWRGTWKEEGGGVMINQALHTLDLLQWICGMPTHVIAHTANDHLQDVIEVEDMAVARFECADGTLINFYATTSASRSFPAHLRLCLKNKQVLHVETDLIVLGGENLPRQEREEAVGKSVWGTGHKHLISDFYRCIREGEHFPIDAEEASKVIRLILSMYASNGKRIEILDQE
jgi:predicted dehydrogenase